MTDLATEPSNTEAGFTILELLVALGIAALVVSLSAARLQGGASASLALEATARGFAQQIRVVRSTAIRTHHPQSYQIDFAAHDVSTTAGLRQLIPAGLNIAPANAANGQQLRIMFYPDGSSTGGGFEIQSKTGKAILTVDGFTGLPALQLVR